VGKEVKVFTQMFYPDLASTAKVLSDLFFNLGDYYKIKVICQNRSYVHPDVKYEEKSKINNVIINRIKVRKTNKNSLIGRIISFIILYRNFKKEAKKASEEIYFCVSNPPFLPYITIKEANRKNKKSVFLLHDLYPDVLVKLGKIKEKSFFYKIIYKMNKYAFKNSSKIIVLGRDVKEYLINNYNIKDERIKIITNWGNNTINIGNTDFRKKHNLQNKFVIMYTGNLGETAEFDTLLNTAKIINNDNIQFIIIGDGRKKKFISGKIDEMQLNNILLLDYLPEEEYYGVINTADMFYVSLKKGLEGISVPSKTYTYLSVGKPIIAVVPAKSEISLSIKEDNYGIYNNYDPIKLREDILEIFHNKHKYNILKENAQKTFASKYDRPIILEKYYNLFKELEADE
jgi:glycosyltransferase involved in cell wall biosynthesis